MRRTGIRLAVGIAVAVGFGAWALAQERTGAVRVSVVPDRADLSHAIGAPARFHATITRDGHALAGTSLRYACGPEMMPPAIGRVATATNSRMAW